MEIIIRSRTVWMLEQYRERRSVLEEKR